LRPLLFPLFLLLCLRSVATWAAAAAPITELQEAQRAGWDAASLLAQGMAAADPRRFPGIHEWLKDYRAAGGIPGRRSGSGPVPRMDVDRLVTRNPAFWRAYFEMSPGDPGTMLLHASLLLAGGEVSRSAYLLVIGRQTPEISKPMLEAMDILLQHSQRVLQWGAQQVGQAAKLHDDGSPAAASARLRTLIDAWPRHGLAHYELGLALLAQQYVSAGVKPPPRSRLSIHSDREPSSEAKAAYARARSHDPLLIRAYQGDDTAGADALLILGKTIRPLWDIIARDTQAETRDEVLRNLASALREANLVELARATSQVLIGREGGYDDEDRKAVGTDLRALAPAAAGPVLKRLAQPRAELARIVLP